MAIYNRKGIFYVDYRPVGRAGPRIRLRLADGTTEDQAREAERAILAGRSESSLAELPPASNGLRDLWASYTSYIRLHRRPRTGDSVEITANHYCRVWGANLPVDAVSDAYLTLYKRTRLTVDGVKPATVNRELAWLSGFLKFARKHGHPAPKLEIERLPAQRHTPVILTPQECLAILKACSPKYRAYFACCYLAGLRRGEVSNLKWEDIDLGNKSATIYGKGGRYRIQALSPILIAFLSEIRPDNPSGWVFPGRFGNAPLYHIIKPLREAVKAAAIAKRVTPHTFRHSMATHLVQGGWNLRVIQGILGHSNIQMTEYYTHIALTDKAQATDALALNMVDNCGQRQSKKALYTKHLDNK